MVLPCEHPEGCMYRYMVKGVRKKYCMGCVVEQFPDADITAMVKKIRDVDIKKRTEKRKKQDATNARQTSG